MWFVYFLLCQDSSIYIGITNNVEKRIKMHNSGRGAKYTRSRTPVFLLKTISCTNKSDALKYEYKLKRLSREEKLQMITNNSDIYF